ncbi:circularin A/uberolysin family circular bacteriocin [Peribacillus simplex]|uniref:uberolysin/carnocyclin family circular bacteriocin n=1 Tax=Peribacillus TaxID=2675229 RepID=UPI0024E220C9|nr:uberolysin/carnocyclin family circular bacteriocin [Peribacillus simplex]MDF9759184.1 circularin A/uberolysin family circular bacteriocin [Peribacillus simplex]
MEMIVNLVGALGISNYWATLIVNAIMAGDTVTQLLAVFGSFGLTATLISIIRDLIKKIGKQQTIAY